MGSEEAKNHSRMRAFLRAFGFAFDGISDTLLCERNMKVHFAVAMLVFLFEFITRPPLLAVILTMMVSASVIASELINTAVESIVNHLTQGERLTFARIAKDAAAGSVLMHAFGAVGVGAYVMVSAWPLGWHLSTGYRLSSGVASASATLVLGILIARTYVYYLRHLRTNGEPLCDRHPKVDGQHERARNKEGTYKD